MHCQSLLSSFYVCHSLSALLAAVAAALGGVTVPAGAARQQSVIIVGEADVKMERNVHGAEVLAGHIVTTLMISLEADSDRAGSYPH